MSQTGESGENEYGHSRYLPVCSPQVPEDDAELAEEEAEQLQADMETDYEIGIAIKEKLIPDAVDFFTGDAADEDEYGGYYGDEDDDEDDDEDGPG